MVKSATYKELAPYDPDWYYIRAASMARKLYLKPGIGVGKFKKIYGASPAARRCSHPCSLPRFGPGKKNPRIAGVCMWHG